MNIIIDRPQLVRAVLLYLNNNFGNLTPKTTSEFPESIYYVDPTNHIMMEYEPNKRNVWINRDYIWSKIEFLFSLSYIDISSIFQKWLEEKYDIHKVSPMPLPDRHLNGHFNNPNLN